MSETKVAPYGSWKSPITSDLIVSATVGLGQTPSEGGRNCVVRRTADGRTEDVTPRDFNARTRVHEYGGGDFMVRGGTVYFSNFSDQRLYRQEPGGAPRAITPDAKYRYADPSFD